MTVTVPEWSKIKDPPFRRSVLKLAASPFSLHSALTSLYEFQKPPVMRRCGRLWVKCALDEDGLISTFTVD